MTRWSSIALQWALMTAVSTLLFVGFFNLNGLLFAQFEHVERINWVFLPAGFRVLLVLTMDVPAALGIALATLWINRELLAEQWLPMACIGLASGFGPWLVKLWMQWRGVLHRDLLHLSSTSLLQYVLVYAAVNAIVHQALFWWFALHDSQPWLDVWPMFFGDLAGALIVLYTVKLGLSWVKNRLHPKD
jgi:hypothetical protein